MKNKMLRRLFLHNIFFLAYLLLGGYVWINKIALIVIIMELVC